MSEHTIPRRVLRTYMEGVSELRFAAGWLNDLHTALETDEGYRWLRVKAGGTWHDRETFVEDPRCSAMLWTGPGHQSRFPCECRTFDHFTCEGRVVHNAWVMNEEVFWTKEEAYDAWTEPEEAIEYGSKGP